MASNKVQILKYCTSVFFSCICTFRSTFFSDDFLLVLSRFLTEISVLLLLTFAKQARYLFFIFCAPMVGGSDMYSVNEPVGGGNANRC